MTLLAIGVLWTWRRWMRRREAAIQADIDEGYRQVIAERRGSE
jgi:hypothetical protein